MSRKKKKSKQLVYEDCELNIMPFIDVFSVLNVFLLMSAAFVTLGSIKVQIPFLSNKKSDAKPTRVLEVKVDAEKDQVTLISNYTMAPRDEKSQKYPLTEAGLESMRTELVRLRTSDPKLDLVTLMTEDELTYDQVIKLIDTIKTRRPTDPEIAMSSTEPEDLKDKGYLFPKVVMGSVIL